MQNVRKGLFCVAKHNFEETGELITIWVDYNEGFLKNMIEKALQFWKINIYPKLLESLKS